MATKRRSQPYRVDWHQPAESLEDINNRLSKLWTDADEMFQILFDDLQATDTTVTALSTSAGSSGVSSLNVIPGRDGDDGIDGATIIVTGSGGSGTGVSSASVSAVGYWSPLTNGNIATPEIVFSFGDTISVWTPTP